MRAPALSALFAVLSGPLLSQAALVSPSPYGTLEGNGSSVLAFTGGVSRLQQVHADLRGTRRTFGGIAMRREGRGQGSGSAGARSVDLELLAGDGDQRTFGNTFAKNWIGSPATVIRRKRVALPDWTKPPARTPAPFDLVLPFDAAWTYPGTRALVWELRVFSSTLSDPRGYYRGDAAHPTCALHLGRNTGTGCVTDAHPSVAAALYGSAVVDSNGWLELSWSALRMPRLATANYLLLGLSNPGRVLPGFCATLETSADLVLKAPAADASGEIRGPLLGIPFVSAFAGVKLYAQAVAVVPSGTQTFVFASCGHEATIPTQPSGAAAMVRHLHAGDLTSSLGQGPLEGGLVIQFQP